MFQLEEDIWFWLLFIVLGMFIVFLWEQIWKKKTKREFSDLELLARLSPDQSVFKSVLKFIVLSLSIVCLIIALVNPKMGTSLQTVKRQGVDVVFAIDVSKSMLAEDIAPNRLEKAKQLTTQIINSLVGDRVGIIAYAGKAIPQLPITTDYAAAKMFLQNMNTEMLSSQGTAINEAIQLSRSYYNDEEQTNRVLVIISDGEDHNDSSVSVAEAAAEEGIKIYTIGVGSPLLIGEQLQIPNRCPPVERLLKTEATHPQSQASMPDLTNISADDWLASSAPVDPPNQMDALNQSKHRGLYLEQHSRVREQITLEFSKSRASIDQHDA